MVITRNNKLIMTIKKWIQRRDLFINWRWRQGQTSLVSTEEVGHWIEPRVALGTAVTIMRWCERSARKAATFNAFQKLTL
jgi:hypothetical protein